MLLLLLLLGGYVLFLKLIPAIFIVLYRLSFENLEQAVTDQLKTILELGSTLSLRGKTVSNTMWFAKKCIVEDSSHLKLYSNVNALNLFKRST